MLPPHLPFHWKVLARDEVKRAQPPRPGQGACSPIPPGRISLKSPLRIGRSALKVLTAESTGRNA